MNQQTTRPTKPIGELTRGEFIHYRDERMEPGVIAEVAHVQTYRNGDGREMVAALFTPVAGGAPLMTRRFADHHILMATEDDLTEVNDTARRRQFHDDLVALQGLLGAVDVRLSAHLGTTLSLHVVEGEVERLAEKLGLRPERFGGEGSTDHAIEWTAPGDEDRGDRLRVKFWGRQAVKAELTGEEIDRAFTERDWFFTFGAGQQFDGRYVRIRGTDFGARKQMNLRFGHAWCDQYEVLPAECAGLTELPESEWPAAPDDKLIEAVDRAFLPIRDEQQGR